MPLAVVVAVFTPPVNSQAEPHVTVLLPVESWISERFIIWPAITLSGFDMVTFWFRTSRRLLLFLPSIDTFGAALSVTSGTTCATVYGVRGMSLWSAINSPMVSSWALSALSVLPSGEPGAGLFLAAISVSPW